jgi:hypothetical protein
VSERQPISHLTATKSDVRASIARAAQATGIDFDYLLAQARLESSLDPAARAGTSSAAGLYQFTGGTWLQTLDRHGADHGFDRADSAIQGGRVHDPVMRAEIMALRLDPDAAALMAGELASDNRTVLAATLGRDPDAAELYMAHFLGSAGASRFLAALAADPGQSAAALLPRAAAANRGIFFDGNGAPRSAGGVMALMRGKMAAAMAANDGPSPAREGIEGWDWPTRARLDIGQSPQPSPFPEQEERKPSPPIAREFAATASMADTLRSTFALTGSAAPEFVRSAYGKLQAFGL